MSVSATPRSLRALSLRVKGTSGRDHLPINFFFFSERSNGDGRKSSFPSSEEGGHCVLALILLDVHQS